MNNNIIEQLETAKKNVLWLLNNPNGSVDMHGLVYWAGVVIQKRDELKNI